jgi:ABC-type multidrug transport system fused ATPase/permease subunit
MIEHFDTIFFMENGDIVERGTHNELLRLKGRYFNLHNAS